MCRVNRWNRPAFKSIKGSNLFEGVPGTSSQMDNPLSSLSPDQLLKLKVHNLTANLSNPIGGTSALTETDPTKFFGLGEATKGANSRGVGNFLSGIGDKIGGVMGGGKLAGTPIGGLVGSLGSAVGGIANGAIGGGLQSGAGEAIGNIGGAVGGAVSTLNPVLGGIVSAGSGVIGGLTNRAFGTKVNQEALNAANQGTEYLSNFQSNVGSTDELITPEKQAAIGDVYEGGWFSGSEADRKNEELRKRRAEAEAIAWGNVNNNVDNIISSGVDALEANYTAFGGPLLTHRKVDNRKDRNNMFKNQHRGLFAFGGDMQTNGGDYPTSLIHIDAGSQHEANPYEGVQLGVDSEGTPNLVEENETVWNDYVFSNRILADETTKRMFRLPKKKDITFADISKRLEKEISERANDPISQAGFNKQMEMLEEQQERQKQEMEAERAKAAFETLSPEEQTALMRQRAQQEAMAQQAAEEQVMAEQQAMQQPTPEERAMVQQQQMMQADGSQAMVGQEPEDLAMLQQNVAALGGQLVKAGDVEPNKFSQGGKKGSRKARRIAKKYDKDWFLNQAKVLGISDDEMQGFDFEKDNPEGNLAAFNRIYRDYQYNRARDTYRKGQRQDKRNELFGDKGLYSYSDDKSKIYKTRTNESDRIGWINKDYTGAVDIDGRV